MSEPRSILDWVQEELASDRVELPVFDATASRLHAILGRGDYEVSEIEQVIGADAALAAELLRLANSPFFRGLEPASTLRDAVARLGAKEIVNLATLVTQRKSFQSRDPQLARLMASLWRHSVACAIGAQWLARRCRYAQLASEAFLAGLLHDIGKLLLLRVVDQLRSSRKLGKDGAPFALSNELVLQLLDGLHAEQGFALLERWGLPESYREVVRDHHRPDLEGASPLVSLVRLADLACRRLGVALAHEPDLVLAASPEAHALGASELILAELEIALEDALSIAA